MAGRNRVAVIGAGPLGLMAIKSFLEEGFDVTCFEARPYVGGLWKDNDDDSLSVHATTIFNSSKFRAAISDFPFPEDFDIYPTAAQIHKYLESYAENFRLKEHIQLNSTVKQILRKDTLWSVTVTNSATSETRDHAFDRVCVATGTFHKPCFPKLDGLDKFSGKVLHSINFHGSEPFEDQNVLLIGMHATSQDVTNALSTSAKHVYLSHRHGLLLVPCFQNGEAFDATQRLPILFIQSWMDENMPGVMTWLLDKMINSISEKAFPGVSEDWGLRPTPSLAVSTPLMADIIYSLLSSGFAQSVPAVKEITGPKSVLLTY